jgi:hypothetical protein
MKIFQPIVTGSLIVSGSVTAIDFTGSLYGSSSYALTASYAMNGGGGGGTTTGSFTGSFTGSLNGTASYALTASLLLGSVTSASYAATASTSTNFTVGSTLIIDQTLIDFASVNSTIVGSNNLFTQATGSYRSAFGKYTLYNGSNARAGEFYTVWNGTTVTYTDISTTDIGATSDIVFSSAIITGNIQINAVAGTSGWTIKMLTTFI